MSGQYDDIIHLPHYVSPTRPQMPMHDRAAQFSPFAALTGYDAAIAETGRLTSERIELTEDELDALNVKYQLLIERLDDASEVRITYFQPDIYKSGGAYTSETGIVKKVDTFERLVHMTNGAIIPMDDIYDIVLDITD